MLFQGYRALADRVAALERQVKSLTGQDAPTPHMSDLAGWHRPGFFDDPEVREFVDAVIWDHTIAQVVAMSRQRFGIRRAPSRSAIGRYRQRIRRAARDLIGDGNGDAKT